MKEIQELEVSSSPYRNRLMTRAAALNINFGSWIHLTRSERVYYIRGLRERVRAAEAACVKS